MRRESLADLSAAEMTAGYRRREFTPIDVFESTTARIDEVNAALNAFVLLDLDGAKKAAEESTTRWAAGESLGLADGIPTTVKDTMDLANWPTRKGSLQTDPNKIAQEDAPMVRRLREGGALILGKTTVPEFGWQGTSDSPLTGLTRNPWDLNRTTGGSSAGAAAAAATGMGKFNTGSDGGGSVRIPAAFTGVFTIKPTFSVIPIHPPATGGLLSYVGPITQTVTDAAHAMSVVAKPDPRAIFQSRLDERSWIDGLEAGIEGLKVAYAPTWSGFPVHPDVAERLEDAVDALERIGADVTSIAPDFTLPYFEFMAIWDSMLAQALRHIPESEWNKSDPGLIATTRRGLALSASDVIDAERARPLLMAVFQGILSEYDVIVTPTMPTTALPVGHALAEPWVEGQRMEHWMDWCPFTWPLNLTAHPATSIPIGFGSDGLPVAMQMIGRHYDDRLLLRAARAFEREHPFAMPDLGFIT